jgi:hypothetical protein
MAMVKAYGVAAVVLMAGLASVSARAETYLEGRFDLNMKESHFPGPKPPMSGGFWVFEKDDGKTRKSHVVQYADGGKLNVYYYDNVAYDGKMNWLNDWYKESNTIVDRNTFKFAYEVHRAGMTAPMKGDATCKINDPRTKITCQIGEVVEVYEKKGK